MYYFSQRVDIELLLGLVSLISKQFGSQQQNWEIKIRPWKNFEIAQLIISMTFLRRSSETMTIDFQFHCTTTEQASDI